MNTLSKHIKLTDTIDLYIADAFSITINKKVKMIYFDPPFNSKRNYQLSVSNQIGFSDIWSDESYKVFITKHIDRLYDILDEKGTLFFHISCSCMYIPEQVLRAKFKFVEPIFWKKCRSKNNVKHKLGSIVDIIFKCTKHKKSTFNIVLQPKNKKYLENSFKNKDDYGYYSLGHLVTEKTKEGYKYEITFNNRTFKPTSGWRIAKPKLEELIAQNKVHFPKTKKGNLYKKIYLKDNPGKSCTDLWDDIHSISQGKEIRKYPTAKPLKLLERLIRISTNENDTVYDPMCGSGTTGEACNNLNRQCILSDSNNDVIDIVTSRFRKD
mgnify:CR=1 FL=1|tara:strand:- start:211 stop:1182 length:972 start_codon:yes stop_codon:yes gene_type:complete